MMVWGPLFIFGGFAGIFFNRVWFVWLGGRYPGWMFPLALLFALLVGLFFTRMSVRLAGKLVDTSGQGSSRKHDLVGTLGVVASAHVDDRFGEIRVRDRSKIEMIVHGRLAGGQPPLSRGSAVVLIEYEEAKELFLVEPSDLEDKP